MTDTIDDITKLETDKWSKIKFTETKTAYLYTDKNGYPYYKNFAIFIKDQKEPMIFLKSFDTTSSKLLDVCGLSGNLYLVKLTKSNQILYLDQQGEYSYTAIESCLYDSLRFSISYHGGLSRMRKYGDFDFEIMSKEKKTSKVHTLVLCAVWPFFQKLQESNMKEVANQKLDMPYPHLWIEAMVSYFYEEDVDMGFIQATGVLILSDVYDIFNLKNIAIARIRKETLDISKCLEGWRNVYEARCDEMQLYLAQYLGEHMKELQDSSDLLKQLSKEEACQLILDISQSK